MDGFEVFNNVSRDDLSGFVERELKVQKEREDAMKELKGTQEHYNEFLREEEADRLARGEE